MESGPRLGGASALQPAGGVRLHGWDRNPLSPLTSPCALLPAAVFDVPTLQQIAQPDRRLDGSAPTDRLAIARFVGRGLFPCVPCVDVQVIA